MGTVIDVLTLISNNNTENISNYFPDLITELQSSDNTENWYVELVQLVLPLLVTGTTYTADDVDKIISITEKINKFYNVIISPNILVMNNMGECESNLNIYFNQDWVIE